jgi:hypothetical protein
MKQFGIGEWRNREGFRATVNRIENGERYPLLGHIHCEGKKYEHSWTEDGHYSSALGCSGLDLVGPWEEQPAPTDTLNREALSHAIVLITQHAVSIRGVARRHSFAKSNEDRLDREVDHLRYAAATLEKLIAKEGA